MGLGPPGIECKAWVDFEWDSGHQEHNEKLVVDDEWDLVHQE